MHVALRILPLLTLLCSTHCVALPHDASADDTPSDAALAAAAAARAQHRRHIQKHEVWTLIDYDLPFTAVRLWVLGGDGTIMMRSRVSHAFDSGLRYATRFSNRPGSNLSSLGSYRTARGTYEGSYGHSLRVHGLDPGVNDNALRRAIVFHPAGHLSHSLGCFMVPNDVARQVFDTIAGGTFVYVHATPQ